MAVRDVRREALPFSSASPVAPDRAAVIEEWNRARRETMVRGLEKRIGSLLRFLEDPQYLRNDAAPLLNRYCRVCRKDYQLERWAVSGAYVQCPHCKARALEAELHANSH